MKLVFILFKLLQIFIGMVFSIDSSNKEIKNKYPVKSEDGNNDDSYRGYSMDIGYFDNDSYEGAHIFSLFIYLFI